MNPISHLGKLATSPKLAMLSRGLAQAFAGIALVSCTTSKLSLTEYVRDDAPQVERGSDTQVEKSIPVVARIARASTSDDDGSGQRGAGAPSTSGSPYEENTISDLTLEPKYAMTQKGLLRETTTYIYETKNLTMDVERFESAAPTMVASQTLSPDSLVMTDALVEDGGGGFITTEGETLQPIPAFPWPPPRASDSMVLDNEDFGFGQEGSETLGGMDKVFRRGLSTCGYEGRYFSAPGGFVLVTRLEQIEDDGSPSPEPARWQLALPGRYDFWNLSFWKNLITGTKGNYRIVALVVSDQGFSQRSEGVDAGQAMAWFGEGWQKLPPGIRSQPFTSEHTVTALVYEFERSEIEAEVKGPLNPLNLRAKTHLLKAGLLAALTPSR